MTFFEYFREHVSPIRFMDRRKSWLMWSIHFILKFASLFLKLFKKPPLAMDDFIGSYITTIGKTIYAHPAWDDSRKPGIVEVHECTHILQDSFRHKLLFIFSKEYRLLAESEAFQAELLCFPTMMNDPASHVSRKSVSLISYGLDGKRARVELEKRVDEVRDGKPRDNPAKVHEAFSTSNA